MPEAFGRFLCAVRAEWDGNGRTMTVLEDLRFIDPDGEEWVAPKGSVVDGASIPRAFWTIVGSPFTGKYRDASVIHDVGCDVQRKTWQAVHKVFYFGMRAAGLGAAQAEIMYAAVYHFGPRWGSTRFIAAKLQDGRMVATQQHIPPPPQTLQPEDFERLRKEIELSEERLARGMSLEEIEAFQPANC